MKAEVLLTDIEITRSKKSLIPSLLIILRYHDPEEVVMEPGLWKPGLSPGNS